MRKICDMLPTVKYVLFERIDLQDPISPHTCSLEEALHTSHQKHEKYEKLADSIQPYQQKLALHAVVFCKFSNTNVKYYSCWLFDFAQWLILPCCKQALRVMIKPNLMTLTLLHLDDVFNLANHDKIVFHPDVKPSGKWIME